MQKRRLGRTGFEASMLGLGGATISKVSVQQAEEVVHRCLDLGINYVDTATAYGDCQQKVGRVMRTRRDEVFITGKVLDRTRQGALEEIRRTLRDLQTDHLDLLQVHRATTAEVIEQVFGPGGSFEAVLEAKRAGLTRFIGITSHRAPDTLVEALKRYDFDTVLIPISMLDHLVGDFMPTIMPFVREHDMGLIGMKPLASTVLPEADAALRWAFCQPAHVVIAGMCSIEQVEANVATAESWTPISEQEQSAMLDRVRHLADPEKLYWRAKTAR